MKILFIAYSFYPDKNVGSLRVSYWATNFSKVNPFAKVTVMTACQDSASDQDVSVRKILPRKENIFDKLITDKGLPWRASIMKYLKSIKNEITWDTVIITGSPFYHFSLGSWFKKNTQCKVVLDFRDTFAHNPTFKDQSKWKQRIRGYLQRRFIHHADLVLTVNQTCVEIITKSCNIEDISKIKIIENGYDDTASPTPNNAYIKEHLVNIVYPGKFYFSPHKLLDQIISHFSKEFCFHYIGAQDQLLTEYKNKGNVFCHGLKAHKDTLDIVASCDLGLIFARDSSDTTTKFFDYIQVNLPILVIYNCPKPPMELVKYLSDLDHVYFCANDEIAIQKALKNLIAIKGTRRSGDFKKYSRSAGLRYLNELILKLHN